MIPNGQRLGIIEGLIVDEVITAEKDVVVDVDRITVTEHKSGAIQLAVVFLQGNVFQLLLQYVKYI